MMITYDNDLIIDCLQSTVASSTKLLQVCLAQPTNQDGPRSETSDAVANILASFELWKGPCEEEAGHKISSDIKAVAASAICHKGQVRICQT